MSEPFDKLFDARGLNCPMPLVNAQKEAGNLEPGQVLKVMASDRGSVADFQGWTRIAKNVELVAQEEETVNGANVYVHYVRRTV
ncbi:MAG: sulfurtransferase TusA family protein [Acidobacteriota bacterium]